MTEQQLLRSYAETRCEEAFARIVEMHIAMVYSVALRRLRDRHLAEDVTQATFALLAQKAGSIRDARALPNWLFKAACHGSANLLRAQAARRRNESEAAAMCSQETQQSETWQHLLPELDAAMETLADKEREAILLRFYEQRPLREVGERLGISEEAARKRVARAVEQLRMQLVPGGALSVNLAAVLAGYHPAPLPTDLLATTVANACQAAGGVATTGAIAKGASIMAISQGKIIAAVVVIAASTGALVTYNASRSAPTKPPTATVGAQAAAPSSLAAPARIDLASAIARLEPGRSTREDVVRLLGEPQSYAWNRVTFTVANLPPTYLMNYPGTQFGVRDGTLIEIRVSEADAFTFDDRLRVGSSLDEALAVMGIPDDVVEGGPLQFTEGVLLKDIDERPGFHYYQRRTRGVRLFFREGRVAELCLIPKQ